jgi:hypothetical protein
MIVQIHARRFASAAVPPKNEPPLFVNTDTMEAFKIAVELFEVVAGRRTQIPIRRRVVDHLHFPEQAVF